MSILTRTAGPALILILSAVTPAPAQTPEPADGAGVRPPTLVADRRLRELPERPRADRPSEAPLEPVFARHFPRFAELEPVPAPEPEPAPQPQPEHKPSAHGDPYGFASILNSYRASAGLHPLAYDPDLSNWASHNNAAQAHRGLGHHVLPDCVQNCGWNYSDAWSLAADWMNSPGHRENMLSPSATRFGIAYGPGPYWTLNAR